MPYLAECGYWCQGTLHNVDCHWQMQTWQCGLSWYIWKICRDCRFQVWRGWELVLAHEHTCRWGIWSHVMTSMHWPQQRARAAWAVHGVNVVTTFKAPIRLYRSYGEWFESGLKAHLGLKAMLFCESEILGPCSATAPAGFRLPCPMSRSRRLRQELMSAREACTNVTNDWGQSELMLPDSFGVKFHSSWGLASGPMGKTLQRSTPQTRRISAQMQRSINTTQHEKKLCQN